MSQRGSNKGNQEIVKMYENENTISQDIWDITETAQRKFVSINVYILKKKKKALKSVI